MIGQLINDSNWYNADNGYGSNKSAVIVMGS